MSNFDDPEYEITYVCIGQVPSGKNQVHINPKTGRHYPNERFQAWRSDAVQKIMDQKIIRYDVPVQAKITYWPGDRRKRDVTGIMDALWHLLEYCKILKNDNLIEDVIFRTVFRDQQHEHSNALHVKAGIKISLRKKYD